MKRALYCLPFAFLVACSSGGGGSSAPICAIPDQNDGSANPSELDDPFESQGKLVLEDEDGPLGDDTQAVLEAGTTLSVQLADTCSSPGPISENIYEIEGEPTGSTPSGVRDYDWSLPKSISIAELRDLAERDSCVRGVANATTTFVNEVSADPMVVEQQHLDFLGATNDIRMNEKAAVAAGRSGNDVVIAVIDTGVDTNHADLKPVLWINEDEVPGNGVDDDKNGYVDDYNGYNLAQKLPSPSWTKKWSAYHHGTHVAGLAAAAGANGVGISGVIGRGARIMGINVFGGDSGARSSDVTNAIRYAADNGADIINLSLSGSGKSAAYESALKYAVKKGSMVLAAAGNQSLHLTSNEWRTPASYAAEIPGVMSIGSMNSRLGTASSFSNWSSTYVEMAAPGAEKPGSGLLSTMPNGGYQRISGTSMATPVAAGGAGVAFAKLRAKGYAPSAATVETLLRSTAQKLSSLATKVVDGKVMHVGTLAKYIDAAYVDNSGAAYDPGAKGCVSIH